MKTVVRVPDALRHAMPLRRAGTLGGMGPGLAAHRFARRRIRGTSASLRSNHLQIINPLETIVRHQWALPLPFGDAHAPP